MRISAASLASFAFAVLTAVIAWWAWTRLPAGAGIPTHYLGLDGIRREGSSRAAIWLIPAVSALVTLALSTRLGMRRGLEAAALPFEMTMISVAGLLLVVEAALIGRAADPDFNVMRPVAIAVGVLLMAIGNYLGKARQNAVFGVRTPWTLAGPTVWDKTHRLTGRLMFLGGAVLVALGLALHDGNALGLSIALCAALPSIIGVAASRRFAQQA